MLGEIERQGASWQFAPYPFVARGAGGRGDVEGDADDRDEFCAMRGVETGHWC